MNHTRSPYQKGYDLIHDRADELTANPTEIDDLRATLTRAQDTAAAHGSHASMMLYAGGLTALDQLTDTTRALRD